MLRHIVDSDEEQRPHCVKMGLLRVRRVHVQQNTQRLPEFSSTYQFTGTSRTEFWLTAAVTARREPPK